MFLLVNTKKAHIQFSNNLTRIHKKRRSATAIRHQGSPQAHLLNGSAPRRYDEVHFTQRVSSLIAHFLLSEVVILMTIRLFILHKNWISPQFFVSLVQR